MPSPRPRPSIEPTYFSRSPGTTYLDRIDPLYEVRWQDASQTTWEGVSTTQHVVRVNQAGQAVHRAVRHPSPVEVSAARRYDHRAVRTVALLVQFHQLSTLQLATLLGTTVPLVWRAASDLYSAGVLDRAVPLWWDDSDDRPHGGSGSIWCLSSEPDRLSTWLDGLSHLEWLLVTSGRDVTLGTAGGSSPSVIRHNLATAEVVTRALEACTNVVGAWGETVATAEAFGAPGAPVDTRGRANVGDAVLVTRGGGIIVIETSGVSNIDAGRQGEKIARKAAGWAAVIARSPLDVRVVFLDASQKPKKQRFQWHVRRGVDESDRYLSRSADRARARRGVFVADAHDWFPLPGAVSVGFRRLESWSVDLGGWVDLLGPDEPIDPSSDVAVNTLGAIHTPPWVTSDESTLFTGAGAS